MKKFRWTVFIIMASMVLCGVALAKEKKEGVVPELDSYSCPINKIEFDDGDSFRCNGEDIRLLGVDTPEIRHEAHGISKDQEFGPEAAAFTKKQLQAANRIVIIRGGKDAYGRTLAHVLVDGDLLSVKIIEAGLGYETISRFGDNGFPLYSYEIKKVFAGVAKPKFEDPSLWRSKNQQGVKQPSALVKR